MTESDPLPSGRDEIASALEWRRFVEELRRQWGLLWRKRINDKVRAEGISSRDFELLFVDRGTVIVATRSYKPPRFREILAQYKAPYEVQVKEETPSPTVGGWRKFGKTIAAARRSKRKMRQQGSNRPRRLAEDGAKTSQRQPLKHGGRGWLHARDRV